MEREKVEKKIKDLMKDIPEELRANNLGKEVRVWTEQQEDMARIALTRDDVPENYKEALREALNDGTFKKTKFVVDKEKVKKLEKAVTKRIKKAIDKGDLPHPDEVIKGDKWLSNHFKNLKKKIKKLNEDNRVSDSGEE